MDQREQHDPNRYNSGRPQHQCRRNVRCRRIDLNEVVRRVAGGGIAIENRHRGRGSRYPGRRKSTTLKAINRSYLNITIGLVPKRSRTMQKSLEEAGFSLLRPSDNPLTD